MRHGTKNVKSPNAQDLLLHWKFIFLSALHRPESSINLLVSLFCSNEAAPFVGSLSNLYTIIRLCWRCIFQNALHWYNQTSIISAEWPQSQSVQGDAGTDGRRQIYSGVALSTTKTLSPLVPIQCPSVPTATQHLLEHSGMCEFFCGVIPIHLNGKNCLSWFWTQVHILYMFMWWIPMWAFIQSFLTLWEVYQALWIHVNIFLPALLVKSLMLSLVGPNMQIHFTPNVNL